MKRVGFEFQEVMSGTYQLVGQPNQHGDIRLDCKAAASSLVQHARDGLVELTGTLDMENVAEDVPVSGWIEIKPVSKKTLRYEFSFTGNDGQPYRFTGQKDVKFLDLLRTMTTLVGPVTRGGAEFATATLRFDVRADLWPFLMSWKPALR